MSLNAVANLSNNVADIVNTDIDRMRWILVLIGGFVSFGICLPIMLYYSYKIYKYRHQSFVRSRHPKMVFINSILSCICIMERVVALTNDLYIIEYNTFIRNFVYIFTFGLYIHYYLLRHWLLFYDLGYREAQVNIRWEHEMKLVRSHWFIDHRRNCGNATFMTGILSGFFILGFFAFFLFHFFISESYLRISISIYGVVLSLLFIFISYKISTINNTGKMKREVFYTGMILLISSIMYAIMINVLDIAHMALTILVWFVSTMVPFVLHLMSTWYHIRCSESLRKRSVMQQRHLHELWDRLPAKKQTLRAILKNVDGFKLFIRHLIKDLCVENLIFLSCVIQFKIMYSFLVQKELEDRKTRTALVEEDESSEDEPDFVSEQKLGDHHGIRRVKTYSNASATSRRSNFNDYIWDDDDEYNEVYGWSMELPQVFGLADKDKIKSTNAYTDTHELAARMYEESLNIYRRFIKVSAKDEVNISHKMRMSLKQYFENEEIINPSNSAFSTRKSTSHDSNKKTVTLPGPMVGPSSNHSNESMNIRLCTQDSLHDMIDSMDLESNSAVSDENVTNDVVDFKSETKGSISEKEDDSDHKRRGSKMGRLQQRFNHRKASRIRSVICGDPNDNYATLNWIQRFKIFDKACDSIEKLLRIDSFGKFRESPEYVVYCEILSKKKMSTSSIIRQTSNLMGNIIHRRNFSTDKKQNIVTDTNSDNNDESNHS